MSEARALDLSVRLALGGFELAVDHRLALEGICAVFGRSGAGKSTLLRVIAGLDRRARGRVAFGARTWQDDTARRFVAPQHRGVGVVFQDARLFAHLSVGGNLDYADRRSRHMGGIIEREDVIEALGLGPLLSRRPSTLSGGERQRVAVGRALLARPGLLLMDEPLAALDARRKAEILPFLARLPEEFRVPVIYVTHALDEVARLAQRLVILDAGRVVADGPVDEILERLDLQPATGRFEAGVVLSAKVAGHDPRFHLSRLELGGQALLIPQVDAAPGSDVRLRVRARDVALSTRAPEGTSFRNVLRGVVSEISEEPETAFAEVLVHVEGVGVRARLTRHAVAELGLRAGTSVFALVKATSLDRPVILPGDVHPAVGPEISTRG